MDTTMDVPVTSYLFYGIVAIVITLVAWWIVTVVLSRIRTVPSGKWEGFQGPTRGVSHIPCGQESSEAIALLDIFVNKKSTTGDGKTDLKELKLILSKLCCIKHDLMSISQVVQATLYIPYHNAHDRENPADTVGRCFTKSVPIRDLDISFATWKQRGLVLLGKLCTSYNLSRSESEEVRKYFMAVWKDVFDIAKNVCLEKNLAKEESPRDLGGLISEKIAELGTYTGYY